MIDILLFIIGCLHAECQLMKYQLDSLYTAISHLSSTDNQMTADTSFRLWMFLYSMKNLSAVGKENLFKDVIGVEVPPDPVNSELMFFKLKMKRLFNAFDSIAAIES